MPAKTIVHALAALGGMFLLLAIIVMFIPSMRSYYANLVSRAWGTTMNSTSTNTLGFILWTVIVGTALWAVGVAIKWNSLKQTPNAVPFKRVLLQALWPEGAAMAGVVILLVFGAVIFFLLRTVYSDQEDLATTIATLQTDNTGLKLMLQNKIHNLNTTDPAFLNMVSTIRAFMSYRRAIGPDAKCMILITFPKAEKSHIEMPFINFAVLGSNCPNGNLQNIGIKPEDDEEESMKGAIPGVIMFHALANSKGADKLSDDLSNLFQVRRSYKLPSNAPENTIWIQFGPNIKWNSELVMEK